MSKYGGIKYQVTKILEPYTAIGKGLSKKEYRENEATSTVSEENGHRVSNFIHSSGTIGNIRNDLKNLGKFAKAEYSIKDMSKIDKDVVKSWIENKENKNNITYDTASNYISELKKVANKFSFTREQMVELREELKEKLQPSILEHRAYEKLDQIKLSDRFQPAFELQRDYGLRVREATRINIAKQLHGNILSYRQKGGKKSEKIISKELANKIRQQAVNGKYDVQTQSHSTRTYNRHLQKEIEKTGQKWNGTHGIRHTFAQNELRSGKTKTEVSHELGHNRESITNTYLR